MVRLSMQPRVARCRRKCANGIFYTSYRNPLHFVERDLIAGAIVELRRAWAFVRRHGLGVFESTQELYLPITKGS